MMRTVSILALATLVVTSPTGVLAAPAAGARGGNVTQQRENRADADQWKRSEAKSSESEEKKEREHRSSSNDDEDEPPKHPGELNGKLDLGDW